MLKEHNAILVLISCLKLFNIPLIGFHMGYPELTMLAIRDHHQVF